MDNFLKALQYGLISIWQVIMAANLQTVKQLIPVHQDINELPGMKLRIKEQYYNI